MGIHTLILNAYFYVFDNICDFFVGALKMMVLEKLPNIASK